MITSDGGRTDSTEVEKIMKEEPVVVRDNENQKHVFIQVNLKKGNTQVMSNFSAWENLALILEGLGATIQHR